MNKRILSTNLFRILIITALIISLGAISPASTTQAENSLVGWGRIIIQSKSF